MFKFFYSFFVFLLATVVFPSLSQAKMVAVKPYIYTSNYSSGSFLTVTIEVFSDNETHPPNYVNTIVLTTPTGQKFNLSPLKSWDEIYKHFYAEYPDTTFGGVIPAGTYRVSVTDASGTITVTDAVTSTVLPLPLVTSPTVDSVIANSAPTFTWDKVTGATYYRIWLYDIKKREPIYSGALPIRLETNKNSITIQKGVLLPNWQYTMRIEARDFFPDVDKRSRTDWIPFSTGSW